MLGLWREPRCLAVLLAGFARVDDDDFICVFNRLVGSLGQDAIHRNAVVRDHLPEGVALSGGVVAGEPFEECGH